MEELHTIPTMEIQHPLKGMFVNEKIAKVLKELGFNESCFAYYRLNHVNDDYMFHIVGEWSGDNHDWYINYVGTGLTNNEMQRNPIGRLKQCFTAPLYQQVLQWFQEKHNLVIEPYRQASETFYKIHLYENISWRIVADNRIRPSLEITVKEVEAIEAGIIEALKLISDGNEKTA